MQNLIFFWVAVLMMFVAGFFGSFLCAFIHSARLRFYLNKNKYDRWRELTSTAISGPGGGNSIRWLKYVYGSTDNDDQAILRYKDSIRRWSKASLFMLLAALVVIGIIAGIMYAGG